MPNALSDDEDAVDEPFEALKTIMENNEAKKAEPRQAREQVEREEIEEISTDEPAAPAPTPLINTLKPDLAPDPDDTFPVNTRVQVWWEDPGAWYSGTVNSTQVWRGEKGKSRNPTRQIEVCYDDDATLTHSLHNNKVRKCEEMPSHELMPPSNPTSPRPYYDKPPTSPRPMPPDEGKTRTSVGGSEAESTEEALSDAAATAGTDEISRSTEDSVATNKVTQAGVIVSCRTGRLQSTE